MFSISRLARRASAVLLAVGFACGVTVSYAQQAPAPPPATQAQPTSSGLPTGIAAKRPVVQASCDYCPWGSLALLLKDMMAKTGYDLQICETCNGAESARIVALRLMPPPISDRHAAQGILTTPNGPVDFGITTRDIVKSAYVGNPAFKEGAFKDLRVIANIDGPYYLMLAVTKESGITDLNDVVKKKMPVRILGGTGAAAQVLAYYGITPDYVKSVGGAYFAGNALEKEENFDIIAGNGVNANNPESNMWYEMSMKKNLVFLPIPEPVRQQMIKDNPNAELVTLPYRYLKGVEKPLPSVGTSNGAVVYARADVPDALAYDLAKALDERQSMLKWGVVPFSYDPKTVTNGDGIPLHPGAVKYYRERGYLK